MTNNDQDEESRNCSKSCKLLAALKDAFAECQIFHRWLSTSSHEEEYPVSDTEDDYEEVIVLAIRTRALEAKLKRKRPLTTENFRWVMSPTKGDQLFIALDGVHVVEEGLDENDNMDAFFSVRSCFSCCSTTSKEAFFSVGSYLSRCSSGGRIKFWDDERQLMLRELCHCEGWPFGLCRRALLLPPLPKSPSESWTWCRCTVHSGS
ncbi:hypothetical protein Scep_001654 [Stephania cephalantha]|uniref:Uncharacterized protein n=1 Tax=Stephania cephalantha TaxID=152367 RepID=A0AAP0Q464_9MAGN